MKKCGNQNFTEGEETCFLSSYTQKAKYQGADKDENIALIETKTSIYMNKCKLNIADYCGSKLS